MFWFVFPLPMVIWGTSHTQVFPFFFILSERLCESASRLEEATIRWSKLKPAERDWVCWLMSCEGKDKNYLVLLNLGFICLTFFGFWKANPRLV